METNSRYNLNSKTVATPTDIGNAASQRCPPPKNVASKCPHALAVTPKLSDSTPPIKADSLITNANSGSTTSHPVRKKNQMINTKAIRLSCAALLLLCTALLQAQDDAPKSAPPVATEIDGVWKLMRSKERGDWTDESDSKFLIFRWNGLQLITKDAVAFSRRTFVVDDSTAVKRITFNDPRDAEKKFGPSLSIYRLDGNRMLLAVPADKQKRSTERSADFAEDGSNWLYEYERM